MRPSNEEVQAMLADGSLVEQFRPMIHKIAHEMQTKHPKETFEDLVSEAYFAIASKVGQYDPSRAVLSTFVYLCVWSGMKNFCVNVKSHRDIPTDQTDPLLANAATPPSWLGQFLQELTEDAGTLVKALTEAPGELADVIRPRAPRESGEAVCQHLAQNYGWDRNRITAAWEEVKSCL